MWVFTRSFGESGVAAASILPLHTLPCSRSPRRRAAPGITEVLCECFHLLGAPAGNSGNAPTDTTERALTVTPARRATVTSGPVGARGCVPDPVQWQMEEARGFWGLCLRRCDVKLNTESSCFESLYPQSLQQGLEKSKSLLVICKLKE